MQHTLLQHTLLRRHTSALSAYVSICQHTSAYVSIRQHTSAYVSIRQHLSVYSRTYATHAPKEADEYLEALLAHVSVAYRVHLSVLETLSMQLKHPLGVEVLHTSAYVSIRQHTSAYVSIRQHTYLFVEPLVLIAA